MAVLPFRIGYLLGFAACVVAMAFALYLEHGQGLEPCPMCIFQRVAMVVLGLVFLLGGVHAPKSSGRWAYATAAVMAGGSGAVIAGRHVWLQNLPPDQVPACGPTLDYLLDLFSVQEVIRTVLSGDGNCAIIDAQWLGLSLPAWTLLAFLGLTAWAALAPLLARGER